MSGVFSDDGDAADPTVGIGLVIIPYHWCRYICPLGTGSMVYGRIRTFGIKAEPEKCLHCKKGCVWGQICPMLIDGEKEVVEKGRRSVPTHCILCMQCVQKCPGHVPTLGRVRWMKKPCVDGEKDGAKQDVA